MSVAISWANKTQLAKCDIMVGFPIPVTYVHVLLFVSTTNNYVTITYVNTYVQVSLYVRISVWAFFGGMVPTNGGNLSMALSPKFARALLKPNE